MNKCEFGLGNQQLMLNNSILTIVDNIGGNSQTFTVNLKDVMATLAFRSNSNRWRSLVAFSSLGCCIACILLFFLCAAIKGCEYFFFPLVLFFGAGLVLLLKVSWDNNKCYRYYMLSVYKDDTYYCIHVPKNMTPEQSEFIKILEKELSVYSGFETYLSSFSCNYTPECFQLLGHLRDTGAITEEDFVRLKTERIKQALRN